MGTRRQFVHQQLSIGAEEELDAQDTDVLQFLENRPRDLGRLICAIAGLIAAGTVVRSRMWLRWRFSKGWYWTIAPSMPRAATTEISACRLMNFSTTASW